MLNDKGPLMFINTVNTPVSDIPQQNVYDSRKSKQKRASNPQAINNPRQTSTVVSTETPPANNSLHFLEEKKLNNIIEMYNKNRPVLCNIICGETEIVGIPFNKDKVMLFVKTSENNIEEIYLDKITDIVIIKF